jgi:hypothetical protein
MAYTKIQSATGAVGSVNASSVTVTTSATGSGNLLVAFVDVNGTAGVTITAPSGWSQVGTTQGYAAGNGSVAMFYKANSTPGVTSFVFSFSSSVNAAVAFQEWSSVTTSSPLDVFVASVNAKATSAPTGTTAALAGSGELAIWGLAVGGTSLLTYSSITNSYVEDTSANAASSESTKAQATLFYNTNVGAAATSSAATMSGTGATGNTTILAVFKPTTATPALSTSPTTLSFADIVGGTGPATQNDTLTNTGGASSAWTSAIAYGSGSGWLGIAASSGTLAAGAFATIVYTCTTGALAAGTYTATVTYTATTGGATATVAVTFVVSAAPTGVTYANYKNTILPNLVAALSAANLLNNVQVLGTDTTSASDATWLEQASIDLSASLAGYVRHAFPPGATDISNDSREVVVKALVATVSTNDPTSKPIIQGEMGFGYAGPGQSVTLYQYGVDMADYAVQLARAGMAALIAYDLDDDMHGTEWGMWQASAGAFTTTTGGTIYVPRLFGGTLILGGSPVTTYTGIGPARPWFFPWSLLSNTLVIGSTLYAPAQPASNDFRCLAATSPAGFWTVVLINRKAIAQNIQVVVPFAPVVTTSMQVYTYSQATPLLVDSNGFPLSSGTLTVVLQRGFTVSIAANSVLILTQNAPSSSAPPPVGPGLPGPPPVGATTISTIDVKRAPLEKRR